MNLSVTWLGDLVWPSSEL